MTDWRRLTDTNGDSVDVNLDAIMRCAGILCSSISECQYSGNRALAGLMQPIT
jgi:hypothetical protein